MGNLITSTTPLESRSRASILRSAFEPRRVSSGMQQLSCDVVFGSPSANCLGTGVCKISARTEVAALPLHSSQCQSAPALLMPFDGGAGLSLVIAREMLCLNLYRRQFRNNVFQISRAYWLPKEVTDALSLKIRVLPPGRYAVEEVDGFFRINFH